MHLGGSIAGLKKRLGVRRLGVGRVMRLSVQVEEIIKLSMKISSFMDCGACGSKLPHST
jgi:hypothetical protein